MDDIETFGEDEEAEEPQWMTNNRQWFAEHQEMCRLKFSPAYLEGWIQAEEVPALPMESDDEPLDIDVLFAGRPAPVVPDRTFIATMDVAEAPDLEKMGVDRLFSEDEHSQRSSSDSRRKYWTKEEEQTLARFLDSYSPSRKVPKAAWESLSKHLNRSQCSVTAKAQLLRRGGSRKCADSDSHQRKLTLEAMISAALQHLPNHEGTKAEIVETVEMLFPGQLAGPKWKNSVKQLLSASFEKVPGRYSLLPTVPRLSVESCRTMQDFIIWAIQQGCDSMQSIKSQVRFTFSQWLNDQVRADSSLCVWEKTLLKKLKMCPFVDHSQAANKFRAGNGR